MLYALRFLTGLILILALSSPLYAGKMVATSEYTSAYLALPERDEGQPVPVILLIHEWWGLNDQIKGMTDQFAEKGFAAIAVDLYRGQVTADPAEAHEIMRGLPDHRAMGDLQAALTYLGEHRRIDSEKIGVIGWCMGGGWALRLALEDARVRAVNMYYGRLVTDKAELAKLKIPLLGIFGERDRGISAESVKEFEIRLHQMGKRAEIHLYPEAGHAFANPKSPQYVAEAAQDAWQKTLLFFIANLA